MAPRDRHHREREDAEVWAKAIARRQWLLRDESSHDLKEARQLLMSAAWYILSICLTDSVCLLH